MEGMGDTVVVKDVTAVSTDEEGRTTATTADVEISGVAVAMVNFAETQLAAGRGMSLDAVVAVPNEVYADALWRPGARVVISGKGEPLDGVYAVAAIRQTVIHRRVLLTRQVSR
jgi:hypothetical protein